MASYRNRVMYAGTTVLVSNYPSWSGQTGKYDLKLLNRVQSSNIQISNPITRSKQIGDSNFAFEKYLQHPDVTVNLSYLLTDNTNELIIGLNAIGTTGILNDLSNSARDRNIFFLLANQDGQDANSLTSVSGNDVISIGNSFLTNYSIKADVGSVPVVSTSFACLNASFQNISGSTGIIPAITLTGGSKATGQFILTSENLNASGYYTNQSYRPSAIMPGDIQLSLPQPLMGGIRYSGVVPANITSLNINVPIERKDLLGFGSNYPYDKRILFPIVGKLSFEGIFDNPVTGDFSTIFNDENDYDFSFLFPKHNSTTGLKIDVKKARVESQAFDLGIGNNLTFKSEFSFKISKDDGLIINGLARNKPGNLLNDDASYQINNRIAGKNPVYSKNVVSVTFGSTVRNKDFWGSNIDLTCACVYNSAGFGFGTLISPRHVVFADHNKPPIGTVLYFTKNDNTYITRTLSSYSLVASSDIGVGLLDSDVPSGISFAKILPQDWADYLKDSSGSFYDYALYQIPIFGIDQSQDSYVKRWWDYSTTTGLVVLDTPTDGDQLSFNKTLVSGDSGGPNFIILNGTVVLLGCNYTSTTLPFLTYYKTQINSAMTSLGGGYQLTEYSLASYFKY